MKITDGYFVIIKDMKNLLPAIPMEQKVAENMHPADTSTS